MPRRPNDQPLPRAAVPADAWPHGPLADDDAVRYVQLIARALDAALATVSLRALSRASGIAPATINAVRHGDRFPDVRTLARLERAAGKALLPGWPKRRGEPAARNASQSDRNVDGTPTVRAGD